MERSEFIDKLHKMHLEYQEKMKQAYSDELDRLITIGIEFYEAEAVAGTKLQAFKEQVK